MIRCFITLTGENAKYGANHMKDETAKKREIVQITAASGERLGIQICQLFALCNDGTIWITDADERTWFKIEDIPKDGR